VAIRLHRIFNPALAKEAVAIYQRSHEGVYIHRELPDFERRYLSRLELSENLAEGNEANNYCGGIVRSCHIDGLERWRCTTEHVRRVGHPLLSALDEIEKHVLLRHRYELPSELSITATNDGWDVDGLLCWEKSKEKLSGLSNLTEDELDTDYKWHQSWLFNLPFAVAMVVATQFILLVSVLVLTGEDRYTVTYRKMMYSLVFAPIGAIVRWKLADINGKLTVPGWGWFPTGTFAANMLGSIVSAAVVAYEYRYDYVLGYSNTFWLDGTLTALRVGFAGSLTTVSTFVAEVNGFMARRTEHAYPYMIITLGTACLLGSLVYGLIIQYV
jgi:fluoride ion exporter CrcB/FEX